jgi:hypothetical protein
MTIKRWIWSKQGMIQCPQPHGMLEFVDAPDYDALAARWQKLMEACRDNPDLADHVYDVFKEAVWLPDSADEVTK